MTFLILSGLEEIMQGITHVYHCAALVSFEPKDKYRLLKINVEGTANVVNACLDAGVQKLVHVSSVSALGQNKKWRNSKRTNELDVKKPATVFMANQNI